jgi:AhpC/TSA family
MRLRVVGLLAALWLAPALAAADEKKDEKKGEPTGRAAKVEAIKKEFQDAQKAFIAEYRKAKTDEERKAALAKRPKPEEYVARALKLAEEDPKDEAAADALAWSVEMGRGGEETKKALDLLREHHMKSPHMGRVATALQYLDAPGTEALLRDLAADSPHAAVRGQATFTLASRLQGQAGGDAQKLKEAEQLFEKVVNTKEFAELKWFRGTLGKSAEGALFEMRHLAVGKAVPDIEGEDTDGKKFKLSDYKGKVVVLDFWGHW